jgi:hypothetical protein
VCYNVVEAVFGVMHGDGEGAVAVRYNGEQLQGVVRYTDDKVCLSVSSSTAARCVQA